MRSDVMQQPVCGGGIEGVVFIQLCVLGGLCGEHHQASPAGRFGLPPHSIIHYQSLLIALTDAAEAGIVLRGGR